MKPIRAIGKNSSEQAKAFRQGCRDFNHDVPFENCPYKLPGSKLEKAWQEGWMTQKASFLKRAVNNALL